MEAETSGEWLTEMSLTGPDYASARPFSRSVMIRLISELRLGL